MSLVSKADEEQDPKDEGEQDVRKEEGEDRRPAEYQPRAAALARTGLGAFFSIHKAGQGYWTRMCTVIGSALLVVLIGNFLYVALKTRTNLDVGRDGAGRLVAGFPYWKLSIVGVLTVGALAVLWHYLNKASVVDFLIATESEMKKVNWTSRKDLFGSTKVVILFMFLIAAALFVIDVVFGYFFFIIKVLKTGPFA